MRDVVNTVKVSSFEVQYVKVYHFDGSPSSSFPFESEFRKVREVLNGLRAGDPLIQGQRGILENEQEDEGGPRVLANRVVPSNRRSSCQLLGTFAPRLRNYAKVVPIERVHSQRNASPP